MQEREGESRHARRLLDQETGFVECVTKPEQVDVPIDLKFTSSDEFP